jgi:hypothetical protein
MPGCDDGRSPRHAILTVFAASWADGRALSLEQAIEQSPALARPPA